MPSPTVVHQPAPVALRESNLVVARVGGAMDVFVALPAHGRRCAAVLVCMDMWGMREALHEVVRDFARAGYLCLVADHYWRIGRVRHAEPDPVGQRLGFEDLAEDRQAALRSAMAGLSDAMAVDDLREVIDHVLPGLPVLPGAVGAIGYCMGGRHVLCAAGALPERIAAVACLHGAHLIGDGAQSPHRQVRHARGEIYFGHAETDPYALPDVVDRLAREFTGSAAAHLSVVHPGTRHGYALPDRRVYDARAAALDREAILAMFARSLPQ